MRHNQPASQQLPSQPPEGAGKTVEQSSRPADGGQPVATLPDVASVFRQPETLAPPKMKTTLPVAVKPAPKAPAPKPDNGPAAEQAPKGQAWVVQLDALRTEKRR